MKTTRLHSNSSNQSHEFRAHILNILLITGITVSLLIILANIITGMCQVSALTDLLICSVSASLVFAVLQQLNLRESVRQSRELRLQNEELTAANHRKAELLGDISHDLKTPLTIISGYAQDSSSMLHSGVSETRLEIIEQNMKTIIAESNRLTQMVSQLLDMAAIEESRMHLHITEISPLEIIQDTLNTYYPMFTGRGNTIFLRRNGSVPSLYCDAERIRRVLINLLSNAVHYTENGHISITLSMQENAVRFTITDDGTGIPPEILPHIFDRYQHETKETGSGKDAGTGLGLYISKYIVEAHGGTIGVEQSTPNGTTIYFTIPLKNSPSETDTSSPE